MGYGFNLKCKSCDYEEEFFLGTGMMYYPLDKVVDEVIKDKKVRKAILEILEKHKVNEHNFGYEIFRCEECGRLHRKFNVELYYDEGVIYRTKYKCPKCRKPLNVLSDKNLENSTCPKCHENALMQDGWVLWD
jgi:DNA-directed RNA polymerase subunit RPC12/RpoP